MTDQLDTLLSEQRRFPAPKAFTSQANATQALYDAGTLDDARWSALEAEVKAEVDDAYTFAEESPDPDPAELFTDVYAQDAESKAWL